MTMRLLLQVMLPDRDSETRDFGDRAQLIIGRSEQCDFSLPMMNDLSRQHAKLEVINGQWHVSDLGSKFGTFVNDAQIERPTLVGPDYEIRIGGHVRFRVFDEKQFQRLQQQRQSQQASGVGAKVPDAGQAAPETPLVSKDAIKPKRPTQSAGTSFAKRPDTTGALPWHIGLGFLTALVSVVLLVAYLIYTADQPKRGYTFLGMTTGIIGSLCLGLVGFYAARKRALQELIPWRLLTWLRWHLWLSIIGFWMIMIHAGFHLDGGSGTWAALLLFAAVATGVVGWYQYKKVPGQVVETVGNLATGNVKKQIDELNRQISDQLAGRDPQIAGPIRKALSDVDTGQRQPAEIAWDLVFENPQDEPYVDEVKTLVHKRHSLDARLSQQNALNKSMRWWLWLHIPASILFGVLVVYHIIDATEMSVPFTAAGPHDFAGPDSCADCHQAQYDDWIGSVHAMAMSSPVTELQNYLVVKKDRFDAGKHGVVVGQLCIECHAPTSVRGNFWEKEDLLATIDARAPSSQFGVSCVACHQIGNIVKSEPFKEATERHEEEENLKDVLVDYKNFENLEYLDGGRTMVGTVDNAHQAGGSIVGNSAHKGQFASHMEDSSFCASCHTVMVDPVGLAPRDPLAKQETRSDSDEEKSNIVTLQNTYHEWKEGSSNPVAANAEKTDSVFRSVNWQALDVNCIDCHGKPLEGLVASAQRMQRNRTPLASRIDQFKNLIKQNAEEKLTGEYARFAADPDQNFDHPLRHKPTHLHTFVGVDYHLEPDMPYPKGHSKNGENSRIQAQTIRNIEKLMKIAAAIKVKKVNSSSVDVQIANLATGHHLPAGFAFAREMWIEVAVDKGNGFRVVAGGSPSRPGQPLNNTEQLEKFRAGKAGKLKNFQAVLWNGDEGRIASDGRHGETVLQNECKIVLKGKKARDHGFFDRQLFLKPGEIRTLNVSVDRADLKSADRVRVRLRFRNYPPEFLEQLADRFRHRTDRYKPAPTSITRELHTPVDFVTKDGVGKNGAGFAPDPEMWDRDDQRATRTENLIQRLRIFDMAEDILEVDY